MLQSVEFLKEQLYNLPYSEEKSLLIENQAFLTIRDIPFGRSKSSTKQKTFENVITTFLKEKKGSCAPKHFVLGMYYESIGARVEYLSYRFFWQKQPIFYPQELTSLLSNMPEQIHVALQVQKNPKSETKLVDATWDSGLTHLGFPINRLKNGILNCRLAVIPESEPVTHNSAFEKWQYLQQIKQNMLKNENVPIFYNTLDNWITKSRSQPDL